MAEEKLSQVRQSLDRNRPLGGDDWLRRTVRRLGLEHTIRNVGRPRKDLEYEK
jgi:hypothetical protein